MILSASRRTDIPCFYADWFMNRIRAGFVLTRNPMNHAQVSKIPLTPDVIDCIVFWTKDARNMLPHLDELDRLGYTYYFQFTLTPYDRIIEPCLRDKSEIEDTFIALSERIGKERVVWRYDPIILNDTLTADYHKAQFERLCEKLSPYTQNVTVSFLDMYAKLKNPLLREIADEEIAALGAFIGATAKVYGLTPKACCEKMDLSAYGIERGSCIDKALIERICGCALKANPDKNQRTGCGCAESVDIGAYNTCMNGCIYCYANDSPKTAKRRFEAHNPTDELLIGNISDDGIIKDRKIESGKIMRLF